MERRKRVLVAGKGSYEIPFYLPFLGIRKHGKLDPPRNASSLYTGLSGLFGKTG